MPEGSEATAVAIWKALLPRISQALERVNGPYAEIVEDRSSLRLDDRYLGPWRGGSLHRTAMSAALDALLWIKTLLESVIAGDGALPMSAVYPVLRTAIESASLSIYLLEPTSRDERLRRSYWVALEDAKYADGFTNDVRGPNSGKQLEKAKTTVRELVAARSSLGNPSDFRFPQLKYSGLVVGAEAAIVADLAIDSSTHTPLIAWWKLLSGLSHGKQWAFITALERSEAVEDTENETALVKLTSSAVAIAVGLQRAVETLEVALRLYGQRSKATWNQPEDATEPAPVPFARLRNAELTPRQFQSLAR